MAKYTPTPEDQDLGGFELIPEGKYYAALDSPEEQLNEEQQKEREGQPDTNFPLGRIRVPFKVSRGDHANSPVSLFINIRFSKGITDYLAVIKASGLADTIAKKYDLPSIDDGWDEKVIQSRKLFNELRTVFPGNEVQINVKHRAYKNKNDEERTAANITSVEPATGSPPAETGGPESAGDWE